MPSANLVINGANSYLWQVMLFFYAAATTTTTSSEILKNKLLIKEAGLPLSERSFNQSREKGHKFHFHDYHSLMLLPKFCNSDPHPVKNVAGVDSRASVI